MIYNPGYAFLPGAHDHLDKMIGNVDNVTGLDEHRGGIQWRNTRPEELKHNKYASPDKAKRHTAQVCT